MPPSYQSRAAGANAVEPPRGRGGEWPIAPRPTALRRLAAALAGRPRLLVALCATLAFLNTLDHQPVFDDGWAVFDNPLVKRLDNVPRMFREWTNFGGNASNAGVWRPLTMASYAVNYALGGKRVLGYHLVNVGLHVLVSLLVLALARRLTAAADPARAGPAALWAGLLFALHPVHVEAVAWTFGRGELLASLGALSALWLALGAAEARWRLPAAAAAAALGVLCKENAAVVPALYLLVALAVPGAAGLAARPGLAAGDPRRALGQAAAATLALALGAGLPFLLRPGLGVPTVAAWFAGQPREVVAGTMSRVLLEYLRLLVFPWPQGTDFYYSNRLPMTHLLSREALLAAAGWGAVLAAGLWALWRRRPLWALGLLWPFIPLLPVSNVLVPTGVLIAERLLYLPSVGACLLLGGLFARALDAAGARRGLIAAAGVALLALAAGKTVTRNADWRDGLTLWGAEVRKTPTDAVFNNNLAVEYNKRGQYARAQERLRVSLTTMPTYWRAWVNLGIAQQHLGQPDEALASYRRAMAIDAGAPSPRYFAGLLLAERGDLAGADAELLAAERLTPEDAGLRRDRGALLTRAGRLAEARAELLRAAALDPADASVRDRLRGLEAEERAAAPR